MTGKSRMLLDSVERKARKMIATIFAFVLLSVGQAIRAEAQTPQSKSASNAGCKVESVDYKGWKAQQVSNNWVKLTFVPQNGGRLMQVNFNGHDYLFVNSKLVGQHTDPTESQWVNYGGDKIWLLPEGDDDEQHWRGGSDVIDAGEFSFRKLSDQKGCGLELTGPLDPRTGVEISRTIRLEPDTPHIAFLANMKNISGHTLDWSMQSVSQYDTGNADQSARNPDIWGFTPANPSSGYLNRYHVRSGVVENPSANIREDGLFAVHYSHVATEFWIDSPSGWLAVVDGSSHYAMVEHFQYEESKTYPGKASVIFWTNGSNVRFNDEGEISVTDGRNGPSPFYMEAELNSPMCHLRSGESCQLETDWYPTRSDREFHGATDAGIITTPLRAVALANGKVKLSGSFGVFFAGKLVAHFYNDHGASIANVPVVDVTPTELVVLDQETATQGKPARVALHLEDQSGLDRGVFQEIPVQTGEAR